MKQVISIVAILLLVCGIIAITAQQVDAAPTYYIRFVVNFYDKDIFNCVDEIYLRASDATKDPITGQHSILLAKTTIEDPNREQYIVKLPFNPQKLVDNSGFIREYLLLEQEEKVVYKDYKRPYTLFDPKRTQYTFTHNVRTDLGCGQSTSSLSIDSQEQSEKQLRVVKVPRGDQNRQ